MFREFSLIVGKILQRGAVAGVVLRIANTSLTL